MRIVNREAFLALPSGTLFAKVDSGGFNLDCVQIKLSTMSADYVVRDLIEIDAEDSNEWIAALEGGAAGEPIPLDWEMAGGRDGLFDQDQMFAVLSLEETTALVTLLTEAIALTESPDA